MAFKITMSGLGRGISHCFDTIGLGLRLGSWPEHVLVDLLFLTKKKMEKLISKRVWDLHTYKQFSVK